MVVVALEGLDGWNWVMETISRHFLICEELAIRTFGRERGVVVNDIQGPTEGLFRGELHCGKGVKS